MRSRHVLLALLCAAVQAPALAATFYGPTGLILDPSAYVPAGVSASLGASTFESRRAGQRGRWVSAVAGAGIAGRAEAGLTYLHGSGGGTLEGVGPFAKLQLRGDGLIFPALAIGVDAVGGRAKTRDAYLVASKRLLPGVTGHPLSVTAGVMAVQDRDGVRRNGADVFGGFEFTIASGMSLVGEWRSRTKHDPKNEIGAMLVYRKKRASFAIGALNNGAADRPTLVVSLGVNLTALR